MKELQAFYRKKKPEIDKRLAEFRQLGGSSEKDIFAELCFCILTPQSRAVLADRTIKKLTSSGVLFNGTKSQIRTHLLGVRFPNNKAGYIVKTREEIYRDSSGLMAILREKDTLALRKILVKKITGYGYKEASHFLRNIGRGENIAILDRHILKELCKSGIICEVPGTLSSGRYIEVEEQMRTFSKKIGIPMDALDLLWWCKETGYIFK